LRPRPIHLRQIGKVDKRPPCETFATQGYVSALARALGQSINDDVNRDQAMHLIQFLLPLHDNNNQKFPDTHFKSVRQDLADRFGGVTAFVRSPAVGLWKEGNDELNRDEVVMFEVMAEQLDKEWWVDYRTKLQEKFHQDEVLIWASIITKL